MTVLCLSWIQTVTECYRQMLDFSNVNNAFTRTNTTLVLTAVLRNFYSGLKNQRRNNVSGKRCIHSIKTLQLKSFTAGNQNEIKTNPTLWGMLQLQETCTDRKWRNVISYIYMLSLWHAIVETHHFICF